MTRFPNRRWPVFELVDYNNVKIPAGGETKVRFKMPKKPAPPPLYLELSEPPAGLSIRDVNIGIDIVTFAVAADRNSAKVGLADNLIIDVSADPPKNPKGNQKKQQQQKVYTGTLPAIPFEITPEEKRESNEMPQL